MGGPFETSEFVEVERTAEDLDVVEPGSERSGELLKTLVFRIHRMEMQLAKLVPL